MWGSERPSDSHGCQPSAASRRPTATGQERAPSNGGRPPQPARYRGDPSFVGSRFGSDRQPPRSSPAARHQRTPHTHRSSKHLPRPRSGDEPLKPFIRLKTEAKRRIETAEISDELLKSIHRVPRDDDFDIQPDERLHVGIHGHGTDEAMRNLFVLKQRQETTEHIVAVLCHRAIEIGSLHPPPAGRRPPAHSSIIFTKSPNR